GRGISGRMRVEWVAGSPWNRWSDAHGMGGQMTVKSAIQLRPVKPNTYSPSINSVIRSVFSSIAGKLGVIILTGMGDDGASGIRDLKGKAKIVMAQDAESSQARSMPDAARETGAVSFSGKPAELARHMYRMYGIGNH
ncbi:chemotaxis protein CheB, partial [Pseudomonas aeruginosa]